MERTSYLPNADGLSILSASILLAYATSRFVDIPPRELGMQLPGFYLAIQINFHTVVALLVAGLTAAGADLLVIACLDCLDARYSFIPVTGWPAMVDEFRHWGSAADARPYC